MCHTPLRIAVLLDKKANNHHSFSRIIHFSLQNVYHSISEIGGYEILIIWLPICQISCNFRMQYLLSALVQLSTTSWGKKCFMAKNRETLLLFLRGCVKRAPTQLLNQLAFRSDAVKSVHHFVIFTTNSCNLTVINQSFTRTLTSNPSDYSPSRIRIKRAERQD